MRAAVIQNGKIVNIAEADPEFAASQGWVMVEGLDPIPAIGWDYDGETFAPPPPPPVYLSAIVEERTRRLALGFDYDFGDARGIHRIGTTAADMAGWNDVTMGANAAIALGAGATAFQVTTDTGPVTVTALEWQAILVAATAFRQPIWAASFVLQAMDPIPSDYTDDHHWP